MRLAAGDFEHARDLFAAEARADRLSAVALAGVGAAELLAGRCQASRQAFGDALIITPDLPCAHLGMGSALSLLGSYRDAATHFHAALVGGIRRPALALAGGAYASCALGLYDVATQQAQAALGTDPIQPLARYVLAAAALAQGNPRPAAALDASPLAWLSATANPLAFSSCIFSPGTAYWQQHSVSDAQRLAQLGIDPGASPMVTSRPSPGPGNDDFRIVTPAQSAALAGSFVVEVAVSNGLRLDRVVVLLDDIFAGVTATRPYRVAVDSRLFADGVTHVRADGYDAAGRVVRTAQVGVRIQNGRRTLAPEEVQVRAAVAEMLEELLLPPISPVALGQLAGHGLMACGQPQQAAAAFEAAYARDASVPGLRTDLLLAYHAMGLPVRPSAPELYALRRDNRSVALTFDDGPHPLVTPWILDLLDAEKVKATFFLVGKQAMLYPQLVREIRRRGHQIGSHSNAHYSLRHLSPTECEQDLAKSRLALREACGETVTLFRPPGGYYDAKVRAAAGALGFTTVFWTCNITSFRGRDGKSIAASIARQCADGGIVLLHNGEDETLDTLPHLIRELRSQGNTLVALTPAEQRQTAVPALGSGGALAGWLCASWRPGAGG